jgi:hypothetical protein
MFASLLCGLLLAVGHHLFYTHLNGQPTGSAGHTLLGGVTRQQLNTTIGTIFAFLVKAFLVIAISIAYAQIMWRDLKQQPTKVDAANTVFSALTSIWSLIHLSVWWRYPLLLLLACAAWYGYCPVSIIREHLLIDFLQVGPKCVSYYSGCFDSRNFGQDPHSHGPYSCAAGRLYQS